jgi:hypothetical protein
MVRMASILFPCSTEIFVREFSEQLSVLVTCFHGKFVTSLKRESDAKDEFPQGKRENRKRLNEGREFRKAGSFMPALN